MRRGLSALFLVAAMAWAPMGAKAYAQSGDEQAVAEEVVLEQPAPETSVTSGHHRGMIDSGKDFKESWEGENSEWMETEPDAFTSDYGESQIARRMTQAEKNRNAKENDGWGGAITIIAMCIVLSALIVLSILFLIFGKVSEAILTARKRRAKAAASHSPHDDHSLAPGEVIAAISLALSEHFSNKHDVEDTHLTIKRLQKAYSPWNSKIYNLRHMEDHRRNPSSEINYHESKRIQI